MESPNRSNYLLLRNSGRKTATHFSWNCSSGDHRMPVELVETKSATALPVHLVAGGGLDAAGLAPAVIA
ncbi:hypothetical protein EN781_33650, partial [Mesorhizobium sp. M4A.F.Ca.ET.090.04.2.1]